MAAVLTEESAPAFCKAVLATVADAPLNLEDELTASEIHGGNLNYAFRVQDSAGCSVFVKQAPDFVKVLKGTPMDMKLSRERMKLELDVYTEWERVLGADAFRAYFPRVYSLNEESMAFTMEFLHCDLLQKSLFAGLINETVAAGLGEAMALMHAGTHVSKVSEEVAERLSNQFQNSELRAIQQAFFLSKCWDDERAAHLKGDAAFMAEVESLKAAYNSENKADRALCHGDLHAGSIMSDDATATVKIIDPEFAIYGPPGLDVGMLLSTYSLAYCFHLVRGDPCAPRLLGAIELVWKTYIDHMSKEGMSDDVLALVGEATVGFAGMEIARTAMGLAFERSLKLEDESLKAQAELGALEVAAKCIRERRGKDAAFLVDSLKQFSRGFCALSDK